MAGLYCGTLGPQMKWETHSSGEWGGEEFLVPRCAQESAAIPGALWDIIEEFLNYYNLLREAEKQYVSGFLLPRACLHQY